MTLWVEWFPDNAYLQALLAKLRYNYHSAKVSWLTAMALCGLPGAGLQWRIAEAHRTQWRDRGGVSPLFL